MQAAASRQLYGLYFQLRAAASRQLPGLFVFGSNILNMYLSIEIKCRRPNLLAYNQCYVELDLGYMLLKPFRLLAVLRLKSSRLSSTDTYQKVL